MTFIFLVFDRKYLFGQIWSNKSKIVTINKQNYVENMRCSLFSVLHQKNPLWTNLVKKFCQFDLKFGTKINLQIPNSMMMFTFSVFDHKYLSWASLAQKFKVVCSKSNLKQIVIQIYKMQWWCLFYLF